MARLSLLLPPWETCSPLMEDPDLLVTGARPAQVVCRRAPCFLSLASILVLPARFGSAGAVPGGDGPSGWRGAPGQGPATVSRAGRGLGERLAPDAALGLVDLAGQVQVEASQHAQRRGVLVRGADGSQGVGHGPGRAWAMTAASLASVLALPGVRPAMRLMGSPGGWPTVLPMCWATARARARAPMVAG